MHFLSDFVELKGNMCDGKSMTKRIPYMSGPSPPAARKRYEQALVDGEIESLPRSPEIEDMLDKWDADGIPVADQIERLTGFFKDRFAEYRDPE